MDACVTYRQADRHAAPGVRNETSKPVLRQSTSNTAAKNQRYPSAWPPKGLACNCCAEGGLRLEQAEGPGSLKLKDSFKPRA